MQTEPQLPPATFNGLGVTPASASKSVASSRSAVSREFHDFVSDMEDLTRELIEKTTTLTAEDLTRARERLAERVSAARNSIEDMGGQITQRARRGAERTNTYVHEQPWNAIGIGALIGFACGLVIARRA